jgi:hypothetical protein
VRGRRDDWNYSTCKENLVHAAIVLVSGADWDVDIDTSCGYGSWRGVHAVDTMWLGFSEWRCSKFLEPAILRTVEEHNIAVLEETDCWLATLYRCAIVHSWIQ